MQCYDFFFLMIRQPPRSTLFPTRRSSDLRWRHWASTYGRSSAPQARHPYRRWPRTISRRSAAPTTASSTAGRSEEHTSELQSRQYLVCRLLLEKKKKIDTLVLPSVTARPL